MSCKELADYRKCSLLVHNISASFKPTGHDIEIQVMCADCGTTYWLNFSDLKIEDFGKLWRVAVNGKEYKPE